MWVHGAILSHVREQTDDAAPRDADADAQEDEGRENYDQQEHPVTGSEDIDAIVVTRTSANTYGATFSHAGQPMGTLERVISSGGKMMTVTTKRRGPEITNVEVYEKDAP